MKYNPETTKIMYICLSSECNKHKMSEIGEFCDDTIVCEDDTVFTDCLFNKKRFNDDMLIFPDNGRPYVSPKYIKFVIN